MVPRRAHFFSAIVVALSTIFLLSGVLWLYTSPNLFAQSQPEALGSISGTVRNSQGEPLANITVWLEQSQGFFLNPQTTTNGQGQYQFLSVPSGIYRLRFEDPQRQYARKYYANADFVDDAGVVTVNGNAISAIDMQLGLGGSISVTLQNAAPLTTTYYGVNLFRQTLSGGWTNYRSAPQPTLQSGAFFGALPEGKYRICAEAHPIYSYQANVVECYDNVLPETFYQLAQGASDVNVQPNQQTTVTITLNDISQVQGVVQSPQGEPLEDIYVAIFQQNVSEGYPVQIVETDEQGHYAFSYLATAPYFLAINFPYYSFANANDYLPLYYPERTASGGTTTTIIDSNTRISITTKLALTSRITGKVTLPHDVALGSTYVTVFRQRGDGSWSDPGQCTLLCPQPIFDYATGAYTVTQITGGNYRLRVDYYLNGYTSYYTAFYGGDTFESAAVIAVGPGETTPNINMTIGANDFNSSIAGVVTANGTPQEGIEAGLFLPYRPNGETDMPFVTTLTDSQGRYRLDGISAGNYRVGFRDPHGLYASTFYSDAVSAPYFPPTVLVTQTSTLEGINVNLSEGGTIRGHVRAQNGKQESGFEIQVIPVVSDPFYPGPYPGPYVGLPVSYVNSKTDADGAFEVTGLPAGSYYLRVKSPFGSGDYPTQFYMYFPGVFDPSQAKILPIEPGRKLNDQNVFLFFTPTVFLPVIHDLSQQAQPGNLPAPIAPIVTPGIILPPPTSTPQITP